jgi:hypothetical protein
VHGQVVVDFARLVAVDGFSLGTSNDCNARDPVMWQLHASPDGVSWVQLLEQRTTYAMPKERGLELPEFPISALRPQPLTGFRISDAQVVESIRVPGALSVLTVEVELRSVVDDALAIAPVGTVFRIAGIYAGGVAREGSLTIWSKTMCHMRELCTTALLPFSNFSKMGASNAFALEATVEQCLGVNDTRLSFSFEIPNPDAARPAAPLTIEALGQLIVAPVPVILPVLLYTDYRVSSR